MQVLVSKFGGSSLADAEQMRKVRDIVMADPQRRYVVPSAPGKRHGKDSKITDLLYQCHARAQAGLTFDEPFDVIAERYRSMVRALGLSLNIDYELDLVKGNLIDDASVDYVASRGEYLNGLVLAEYLGYDFVDATELVFFDRHGIFDSERTQEVAQARLRQHNRAVIPGFYGSMPDRAVKTFSRGGSDITGAIIARAVDAALYENWTDVSGFFTVDPRIIPDAKVIDSITYQELRELSYMGSTVLHEDAVFPVRQAGIPINIRNTNIPQEPGTMIVSQKREGAVEGRVTGIAGRRHFSVINVEKAMMNLELGFGRKVLWVLEQHGILFEHMPTGIDVISVVVVSDTLVGKREQIIRQIRELCRPDSVEITDNMALVATVGTGMVHAPGTSAQLFAALARAGVNVRMINQGSSELNIIVGVEDDDFEVSIRAIYDAFVR